MAHAIGAISAMPLAGTSDDVKNRQLWCWRGDVQDRYVIVQLLQRGWLWRESSSQDMFFPGPFWWWFVGGWGLTWQNVSDDWPVSMAPLQQPIHLTS